MFLKRGPLLRELPKTAQQEEVVARVEVVELVNPGERSSRAKVLVVQAIKGAEVGQVFVVEAGLGTCAVQFGPKSIGLQRYIAGHFIQWEGTTLFVGSWLLFVGEPKRTRTLIGSGTFVP
jgi:hypothetical protein